MKYLSIALIAVCALFVFGEHAAAQQQPQAQPYWLTVRTPWYPGKNLSRGFQGAFGYSVPPRYWQVPVAPTQPQPLPPGYYLYRF